ncbi:MAG: hypothetical protein JSR18_05290 [Proteobacteria bacterium]|nr:hypothetical protein [Pseudomonadota bacterium]
MTRELKSAVVILVITTMAACSMEEGRAIQGVVTELGTHKPVQSAQVIVNWEGYSTTAVHSTSGGCFELLAATTDAEGRFSVPFWQKEVPGFRINTYAVYVYARGYGYARGQVSGHGAGGQSAQNLEHVNAIEMPPAAATVRERLLELSYLRSAVRCPEAGASRSNAINFYRSMNEELLELAQTPEGRAISAAEAAEIDRRKRLGLPMIPILVVDLAPLIRSLQSAMDGDIYEAARTADVTPSEQPTTPGAR